MGEVRRLEADPSSVRERVGDQIRDLGTRPADEDLRRQGGARTRRRQLTLRLVAVAAVGDQHHDVGSHDPPPARPGEPGEPAQVRQVADQQRVGRRASGRWRRPAGRRRSASSREPTRQRRDGQLVADHPEPDDRAGRDGADDARVPPRLARVRVGDVDLDDRSVERGERVVDAPRVVGERAGVDDDRVGLGPRPVDRVDELALVVRLERPQLVPGRLGRGREPSRRSRRASPSRRPPARASRAGSGWDRAAGGSSTRAHRATPRPTRTGGANGSRPVRAQTAPRRPSGAKPTSPACEPRPRRPSGAKPTSQRANRAQGARRARIRRPQRANRAHGARRARNRRPQRANRAQGARRARNRRPSVQTAPEEPVGRGTDVPSVRTAPKAPVGRGTDVSCVRTAPITGSRARGPTRCGGGSRARAAARASRAGAGGRSRGSRRGACRSSASPAATSRSRWW